MIQPRTHASPDAYDPFEDTRGPVSHALHFDVERIPGAPPGEPARFRKTIKPGVGPDLLPMIHRENMLLMDMAARRLAHVAQSLEFTRASSDTPFVVTTLDAGPSLNLWRGYHFAQPGDEQGEARSFLTPSVFLLVMQQLLVALREFHDAGFIHCDIHAGNLCVPFDRQDGPLPAVRPLFERLRLIDFGHTLSARLKFEDPLCLDPDAPESLRRVSPAFRAALRSDAASHRADEVLKLDFRLDLHAMGALAAQLLGRLDWASEPRAVELHPAMAGWVGTMLMLDCDGKSPEAGLHDRLLRPLDAMLARLEPSAAAWLVPRRRAAGASPTSPDLARETPLIAPARETPLIAPARETPLIAPSRETPFVVPRPDPMPGPGPAPVPASPGRAAAFWRTTGGRNTLLGLVVAAVVAGWAWQATRVEDPSPVFPRAATTGTTATTPPVRAPAKREATPPRATESPSPVTPARALTAQELDDQLNAMLNGAASGEWGRVEQVARAISAATAVAFPRSSPSPLLVSGESAIERRDYQAAVSTLRRATMTEPGDWKAWSALGYALLRTRQVQEAKSAFAHGLRLRPQDASAWAHLGEIFAMEEQAVAAAESLKLAVYFSTQRARTLAHLRAPAPTLIEPPFQAVIRGQGSKLDQIPERTR